MKKDKFPNLRDFLRSNKNGQIIFSNTEPGSNCHFPKTSEFKLGTVISVFFNTLKIKLGEVFLPVGEKEEAILFN